MDSTYFQFKKTHKLAAVLLVGFLIVISLITSYSSPANAQKSRRVCFATKWPDQYEDSDGETKDLDGRGGYILERDSVDKTGETCDGFSQNGWKFEDPGSVTFEGDVEIDMTTCEAFSFFYLGSVVDVCDKMYEGHTYPMDLMRGRIGQFEPYFKYPADLKELENQ